MLTSKVNKAGVFKEVIKYKSQLWIQNFVSWTPSELQVDAETEKFSQHNAT